MTAISKNYYVTHPDVTIVRKHGTEDTLDLNDTKTKILIYEDRVKRWFLEIAEKLKKDNEAGFVILAIAVAYIEGNQQFRDGKSSHNQSKKFFIKGVRRIFDKTNVPESILESYYEQIRCGLFHDGITKKNVVISGDFPNPISYAGNQTEQNGVIKINPHKFLDKIKADFEEYISQLKDGSVQDTVKNFERRWELENA